MPITAHDGHVRVSIRLTPQGGRDFLEGVGEDASGDRFLRARVRAVPENGKANKALIELLAKDLGIARSAISLVSGHTARKKILRIDGDPEDISSKLMQMAAGR